MDTQLQPKDPTALYPWSPTTLYLLQMNTDPLYLLHMSIQNLNKRNRIRDALVKAGVGMGPRVLAACAPAPATLRP